MVEQKTEVVLGVTQNQQQEVLIIQRKKEETGTGKVKLSFAFPGGKRESGENIEDTAEREVLEETGYEVKAISIISERQHPQFPVYIYYLKCVLLTDLRIEKFSDEEIVQAKWVNPKDLTKYFTTHLDPKVASHLGI